MRRVTLVIREDLLEEVVRLSGERTNSRAVERALQDFVRRTKSRKILELAGSGAWDGELAAIREERPLRERQSRRRGSR